MLIVVLLQDQIVHQKHSVTSCVQFFGGDGVGGFGRVILGGIVDNTEGLSDVTADLSRTASIIGVEITDPGSSYFSSPPVVSFEDPCRKGYGAIGRA